MIVVDLNRRRVHMRVAQSAPTATATPTPEDASGRPFSELPVDQQRALLRQVLEVESPIAPDAGEPEPAAE